MTRRDDPREEFGRRTYGSLGELLVDQARLLRAMDALRRDAREGLVTKAFRERLMLAHTHVIQCRYCSWAHARAALGAGIPAGEVECLLCGVVDGCPEDEGPGLLYALHFAEKDGHVDAGTRARLAEVYGEGRAGAIDRALHAIRSGNLLGNTIDYLLFRITFGRVGGRPRRGVDAGPVLSGPSDAG